MSGMVFRYFFFVLSFLVLWLQPSDFGNYKSFFITFFTFIGSWWIDKIAATVDGIKAYKKVLKSSAEEKTARDKRGIINYVLKELQTHIKVCGNKITTFFVMLNAVIMTVCICIGSFLFILTITGIMNFVVIEPKIDENTNDIEGLQVVVCLEDSKGTTDENSYIMQQYLFENIRIDVKLIFQLTFCCVILEVVYLLIYACFSEFYMKLNGESPK